VTTAGSSKRRNDQADGGWARSLRVTGYLLVVAVVLLVGGGVLVSQGDDWFQWSPSAQDSATRHTGDEVRFPDSRYPDLAAAVAATPDGGVLRLAARAYTIDEALVLDRSLTLVGAGDGATTLTSSGDAVLHISGASHIQVQGIALRHAGDTPSNLVMVLLQRQGHATFVDCSFSDATVAGEDDYEHGAGLDVRGRSQVLVQRCSLSDNPLNVAAFGPCRVTIDSCTLTESGTSVAVMGRANVAVTDSVLNDNWGTGLWVDSARATVSECSCLGNLYGLSAWSTGRLVVTRCHIEGNRRGGVTAMQDARLTITDCDVFGNNASGRRPGVGVYVTGRAHADIFYSRLGNSDSSSSGQRGGILVDRHGSARVVGAHCIANLEYGVLFTDAASGTVRRLSCSGSPEGLVVGPEATVAH
jgi:hypothetical protein